MLFSYNKDVLVFDHTLRQCEVCWIDKMDNYLVLSTLLLDFCIALSHNGMLSIQNPPWLWWMWYHDGLGIYRVMEKRAYPSKFVSVCVYQINSGTILRVSTSSLQW